LTAAELKGAIRGCHDPSRIIYAEGKYWIFSTAPNINLRSSTNLVEWKWEPRPFSYPHGVPEWMTKYLIGKEGNAEWNIWAPDIIKVGDRYLLFYSRNCGGGSNEQSVCGVTVSQSLAEPNWVDQGEVLSVRTGEAYYRVIDPAPVLDARGRLWLAVGSFGSSDREGFLNGGIRIFELNPTTCKLRNPRDQGIRIAGSWIEAPYIHRHGNHYYLFFNEGKCCQGKNSTYFIRVGRSVDIRGPYVDKIGRDLRKGGGTLFMGIDPKTNQQAHPTQQSREIGPGHVGIFTSIDGIDRLTYHFYDGNTPNGVPTLGLSTIVWDSDGWPRAVD
jgi:arabinan endo-1,5-alpha-L-arabinosidase